ncbi:unnamed protein product [Cuscuta epithymum]|uniref:DRBM domain-containing protein n=1 Tax=Cuscuta epithymum TaxID=186058 RepID=A0AAV0FSR9_9ASTE|nr:unnamed protein product [Cuscuta epithymum]
MSKGQLQELCQRLSLPLPQYTIVREGPDHDAKFNATVIVNGLPFHSIPNKCRTSKEAQNLAARFAFEFFSANPPDTTPPHLLLPPSNPALTEVEPPPSNPVFTQVEPPPSNPAFTQVEVHPTEDPSDPQPALNLPIDPQPVSSPQSHNPSGETVSPLRDLVAGAQSVPSSVPSLPMEISTAPCPNQSSPQRTTTEVIQLSTDEHASMRGMYKSQLQDLCRKHGWKPPEYKPVKEGPDHMPRFTATVIVNGTSYTTPHNHSRSSKEATKLAAFIAVKQLTSLKPIGSQENAIVPSNPDHTDVKVCQNSEINAPTYDSNLAELADRKLPKCSAVQPIYKNWLQQYAQKQGITLPEYCCEAKGPPHDRHFKPKVAFAERVYEGQQFFRTLKEAEQAAAKIVIEALSPHEIQKGGGLYKNLLQEVAQKLGFLSPVYKTIQDGPPHNASFVTTVQVGDETYEGQTAKSKKLAEMNAAEVAYNTLINRGDTFTKRQKQSTSPGTNIPHPPTTHGLSLCQ